MISLSKEQKSILIGTILGDGYLQKTGKRNARLRLEHGYRQKHYLLWKVKKLGNLFQGRPKYLERIHPKTKKKYRYYRHQSQSTPYLGKLRKVFYPQGKKVIPQEIEGLMDPLMLAVWYMDDGYYYLRDRCSYLYLGNVKEDDAKIAQKAIVKKFKIEPSIKKKKNGYALYFSPGETLKLAKLIKPYVLKEFLYKLPS